MLVAAERPVALERHLGRLRRSARELFDADLPAGIREDAAAACAGIALGRVRLEVTFEGAPRLWVSTTAIEPHEFFPPWERGAMLRTVPAPQRSGAHKLADRDWLERIETGLGEAVPLLLGADGVVLEAGRANVFAVCEGALWTPPLDGRILAGTARAATIELAGELGIEVAARPITPADLRRSGQVFLTSSTRGIRPARSLDGLELPGHATSDRLAGELRRRWLGG